MSTESIIPAACYCPAAEEAALPSIELAAEDVVIFLVEEDIDESFDPTEDDLMMIDGEELDREME